MPAFERHLRWRINVRLGPKWTKAEVKQYIVRVVFGLFYVWRAFVDREGPISETSMAELDQRLENRLCEFIDKILNRSEEGLYAISPGVLDALRCFLDWELLIMQFLGLYTLRGNLLRMNEAMIDQLFAHFMRPSSFDDIEEWEISDTVESSPQFTAALEAIWAAVRAA